MITIRLIFIRYKIKRLYKLKAKYISKFGAGKIKLVDNEIEEINSLINNFLDKEDMIFKHKYSKELRRIK